MKMRLILCVLLAGAADAFKVLTVPTSCLSPVRPALRVAQMVSEEVDQGTSYYKDQLCDEEEEECQLPGDHDFCVAILGDLHLDPRKMEDYYTGRDHIRPIIQDAQERGVGVGLVSLGDLGESKSVRPEETSNCSRAPPRAMSLRTNSSHPSAHRTVSTR